MGLELFNRLRDHAHHRGDDAAVRVIGPMADEYLPLTWRALWRQTWGVAAWLDATLPGDAVVMLVSRNRPAVLPAFLGVLASGRTVFPVDAALTPIEISHLVEGAGVAAILADDSTCARLGGLDLRVWRFAEVLAASDRPTVEQTPDLSDQAWLLLQSSGTTGGPKIVKRSGSSLDAVARNVAQAVGLRADDCVVAAVPLSHSYGIENGLLAPLFAGSCALHHVAPAGQAGRGFDPGLAVTSGATVLAGVPAMFEMIDRMRAGRGSLRLAYSAGASLPIELAERLAKRDGLQLGQLYGSTEVGSVTYGPTAHHVGTPMQGVVIRILNPDEPDPASPLPDGKEGHVAVQAPSMFDGYLNPDDDDALVRDAVIDGFFLTGDLGRLDDDGQLHLTGRLKLLIDVGGVKVNPLEVEAVLAGHPHVDECVIVPDPVSPTVSRVRAILTVTSADYDESAVRAYLRQRLAAHKIPRTFEVRDELPKSPTGKVLRQRLMVTI